MGVHKINAGKYFSKLVPPVILVFTANSNKMSGDHFWIFFAFNVIATSYCTVWDYIMDWGLFRCWDKGKYMLRPEFKYPAKFYYFAMVTNFFLRFFWIVSIFTYRYETPFGKAFNSLEMVLFISIMAEAIRRTQWALIRVENEFYNNFEKYRSIPTIPNLMEDV